MKRQLVTILLITALTLTFTSAPVAAVKARHRVRQHDDAGDSAIDADEQHGPKRLNSSKSKTGNADEITKLLPNDGAWGDRFGRSVSLSGSTLVRGAPRDDDNGNNSGSVYVFVRDGNVWKQQAKLLPNDGAARDFFGSAVSLSENTLAVGASRDDDNGNNSGSVYVFVRDGNVWKQQAKLLPNDGAARDFFGSAVSLSGNTLAVGACRDDDNGSSSGSVYVFVRDGNVWKQQAKLLPNDEAARDFFGSAVSLSENTLAVGASRDDDNGNNSGSVYVFDRDGNVWKQQAKLLPNDGAARDFFGSAVSLSGNTLAVGASRDDDNGSSSGSVYVFVRDGNVWKQQAKLLPNDEAEGDWFGGAVSLNSDNATQDQSETSSTQSPTLTSTAIPSHAPTLTNQFLPGELLQTNKRLGIVLSAGLEVKRIASTGKQLKLLDGKRSSLPWHSRMDGAGVIDLGEKGYVYVSNSEESDGGVHGLYFNLAGDIIDYQVLLKNTRRNCGGGLTPWNTWISCEEVKGGQCWQVAADPTHPSYLRAQATLIGESGGRFESVATDNRNDKSPVFFVTEDSKDGAMRRFEAKSNGWQSLHTHGDISYLRIINDRKFEWTKNLNEARESANTYYQNSEGVSFNNGTLFFTAKSTQKLFALDLETMTYEMETTGLNFQGGGSFNANPDQVINGNKQFLYFSESGGNTPGVYVRDTQTGRYMTIFEAREGSYLKDETVGIAFSPDRVRMYAGYQGAGVLFEFTRVDGFPFP